MNANPEDNPEMQVEPESEPEREPESDSEMEVESEPASEIERFTALAHLDAEAAAAYEIALDAIDERRIRKSIEEFRGDHLRHIDDLNRLIVARGGEEVPREPDPEQRSVLTELSMAAAAMGPFAALLAMIANEQLTNSTYESALLLVTDDESREVVERNFADERRHFETLVEYKAQRVEETTQPPE